MTTEEKQIANKFFKTGVELVVEKIQKAFKVFDGYPENKLTAEDVKLFVEAEFETLKDVNGNIRGIVN